MIGKRASKARRDLEWDSQASPYNTTSQMVQSSRYLWFNFSMWYFHSCTFISFSYLMSECCLSLFSLCFFALSEMMIIVEVEYITTRTFKFRCEKWIKVANDERRREPMILLMLLIRFHFLFSTSFYSDLVLFSLWFLLISFSWNKNIKIMLKSSARDLSSLLHVMLWMKKKKKEILI